MHASAPPELQVVQAAPPEPQAVSVLPGMHVDPLQQPLGQLAALQTHRFETQRCVAPHSAFEPHRQLPADEQLFARFASQALQVCPLPPHCEAVGGATQSFAAEQQPLAQLVPSHTHAPPTQWRPTGHWALLPQRHWPVAQALARTASHAKQAPPSTPHWPAVVAVMHVEPLQHPLGQVAALQPEQAWPTHMPPPHEAHCAPPVPHSVATLPGRQAAPAQQPPGQLAALHAHAPDSHACPLAQAPASAPHAHTPFVQRSAFASQGAHAAPAAPQLLAVCVA